MPLQHVTRRYLTDEHYSRDAAQMAAAGWRVASLTREPSGAIVATYAPPNTPPVWTNKRALAVFGPIGAGLIIVVALIAILIAQANNLAGAALRPTPQPTPQPTISHVDNSDTPTATSAQLVSGPRLGGPIVAFDARYGSDNPPGPVYQWNTIISGDPVQLSVSLALANDATDGQYRALIIDITSPTGAGTPWSAAEDSKLVNSFLPTDAHHTKDVAGSNALGPDHIYISKQLAASLSSTLFKNAAGHPVTSGTFDWQCSTTQQLCEIGVGTNS